MKQIKVLALALCSLMAFTACNDEDEIGGFSYPRNENITAYVVNQGNYYGSIDGTLGQITVDNMFQDSLFAKINGSSLGNTPQDAVLAGNHLFVAMYGSNVVHKLNSVDLKMEETSPIQTSEPRDIVADGNYVYVSNYDGKVTKIDIESNKQTSIEVGPNPEEMVVANGSLYVAISDGMNYGNNYAKGFSVAKINLSTFEVEKQIKVGMNPTKLAADAKGNVFVVCMGDYFITPATVMKITPNDEVSDFTKATMIATNGNVLYGVNSVTDYTTYTTTTDYVSYNTETGDTISGKFIKDEGVDAPTNINVNTMNGKLYLLSDNLGAFGADYSAPGYIKEYSKDGTLLKKYSAGVHPVSVIFNR